MHKLGKIKFIMSGEILANKSRTYILCNCECIGDEIVEIINQGETKDIYDF